MTKKRFAMFLAAMMLLSLTACGGGGEPAPAANDPAPASEPRIAAEDVIEKAMEETEEFESFSVEAVEHYLNAYGVDLSELEPKWEWELKSKYSTYADDPSDGYGHAVALYSSVGRELTDEEIDDYFAQVFDATAAVSDDGYNIIGYEFVGEGEEATAQVTLEEALDSWMPGWGFRYNGKFMVVYVSSEYDNDKDSELDRLFYYNGVQFDIGVGLQKSFDDTWAEMEEYFEENEDEIKQALEDYVS